MNKNNFYANLIALVHFFIILLVIASLPLVIYFPAVRILIVILLALTVLQWWLFKDHCFLSDFENKFRSKYDKAGVYHESCIAHYIYKYTSIKLTNLQVDIFLYSYFALTIFMAFVKK